MSLATWLLDQKLSDWVQGIGSLAAAGAAVWIALRQERVEHHRAEGARALRREVLAAAIVPVLRDMDTTARIRNGLLQTLGRRRQDEEPPHIDELQILLPDIFMATIDRIDVFGATVAANVYSLVHRVNDYNRNVQAQKEWDVPVRTWAVNLRPKLDSIIQTLDILIPPMESAVARLESTPSK